MRQIKKRGLSLFLAGVLVWGLLPQEVSASFPRSPEERTEDIREEQAEEGREETVEIGSGFLVQGGTLIQYDGSGGDVVVPDGITAIGESVFAGKDLTSVAFPDSLREIGPFAFDSCESLTKAAFPAGLQAIGSNAFSRCGKLTEVTLPDSLVSIGYSAFWLCESLTEITIPNSVTSLGDAAFSSCTGLTRITLSENLSEISTWAFRECASLTELVIPNGVRTIAPGAFALCESLETVSVPKSVTRIAKDAFQDTPWLAAQGDFAVVNGLLFVYQGQGGDVKIPDGVVVIGDNAFEQCTKLKSVILPASVTTIGDSAFFLCRNFRSITIPATVSNYGAWVFANCKRLKIRGTPGSAAEACARENSIPFEGDLPAPAPPVFQDVSEDSPYAPAIRWAVGRWITTGKRADMFAPYETCSTGQILIFLWRAMGYPLPAVRVDSFGDELPIASQKAVLWACERGIVSEETLDLDKPCTRGGVVTYLWRLVGGPEMEGSGFEDVPADAEYASAVAWAVENGITSGKTAATFDPDGSCSRGQVVTFLYRAKDLLEQAEVPEAELSPTLPSGLKVGDPTPSSSVKPGGSRPHPRDQA